jgi:hypothetical protein
VGSPLAQPAVVTAARQSAKINLTYLQSMVVVLGATDVAQVGIVLLIMAMLLNLSELVGIESDPQCSETGALLALDTRLFNGDCVADPRGA